MPEGKKKQTSPSVAAKYKPNDATSEEVIDGATRLLHRLGRHLDVLEVHAVGAVDDVASVLRTIAVRGAGDGVVHRLCRMTGVPQPQVFVSAAVKDDPNVLLAIGAIPTSSGTTASPGRTPPAWVAFDRWTSMTVLIVRVASHVE